MHPCSSAQYPKPVSHDSQHVSLLACPSTAYVCCTSRSTMWFRAGRTTGCVASELRWELFIFSHIPNEPSTSLGFNSLKLPIIGIDPMLSLSGSCAPKLSNCSIRVRSPSADCNPFRVTTDGDPTKWSDTLITSSSLLILVAQNSDLGKRVHEQYLLSLDKKT